MIRGVQHNSRSPEDPLENRGKVEGVAVRAAQRPIDGVRFKISDESVSGNALKMFVTEWFLRCRNLTTKVRLGGAGRLRSSSASIRRAVVCPRCQLCWPNMRLAAVSRSSASIAKRI